MGDYGDAFSEAVAAELRGARAKNKNKPTIAQIVVETGLAKSTVLNYLNGKRDMRMGEFAEICRVLGVDPRAIFDLAENAVKKG